MKAVATGRRRFVIGTLAATALSARLPALAAAPAWPSRPIRLICPWTAGGSSDIILRAMALVAGRTLDIAIVIDNKPGASGILGATELAGARPDGYTVAQIPFGVFSMPHMQKLKLQPLRDIAYVANLSAYTNGLVVRADSPYRTIGALIEAAKAQPGTLTYACAGVGSFAHISTEEFAYRAGIRLQNVPYKGDADGLQALLSGQVMALSSSTSWASYVDSGACRLLASYGSTRIARWPDAPTLRELGFDTIPISPFGLGVSKGTDPAIVLKLQDAFHLALGDPSVLAVLAKYDMPAQYMDASAFTRFAHDAFESHQRIIGRLGLAAA